MSRNTIFRALSGQILGETEKAIRFQVHAPEHHKHGHTEWFPISQMASIHRCYDEIEGIFDILMLSEWILGQKSMLQASVEKNPALIPVPYTSAPKREPTQQANIYSPAQTRADRLQFKADEDDIPF